MNHLQAEHDRSAPRPAVAVQALRFTYNKAAPAVLDIPAWTVEQSTQVFLKGPSGAGKSTLLSLMAGILTSTNGTIEVLGQNLAQLSSRRRDRFRAAHIGLVFQQFNLVPYLSVADNILLAAHFAAGATKPVTARMHEMLHTLGLDDALLSKPATALSVGQQQRVAIARALINDPQLIIVDEPTSSLDSDARDAFMELLLQMTGQNNKTLVFVSHDQGLAHHFTHTVDLAQINTAAAGGANGCC